MRSACLVPSRGADPKAAAGSSATSADPGRDARWELDGTTPRAKIIADDVVRWTSTMKRFPRACTLFMSANPEVTSVCCLVTGCAPNSAIWGTAELVFTSEVRDKYRRSQSQSRRKQWLKFF